MSFREPSKISCEPTQRNQRSTLSTADFTVSPAFIKEDIHKNVFGGKTASIQRVTNGGHLIPQVQPDGVADAVLNTFSSLRASSMQSRL